MRMMKAVSYLVIFVAAVVAVQAQKVRKTISYDTGVSGIAVDYETGRAYVLLPNFTDTAANVVQVLRTSNATAPTKIYAGISRLLERAVTDFAGQFPRRDSRGLPQGGGANTDE